MNDWELIQAWCRNGSESAFETLVKRHVDFVYCCALRQVRDPAMADDVSQAVFLLLARKARSFRSGTVLSNWLFRTTRFIAARALRSETRRQRRELQAANMNSSVTSPDPDHDSEWNRVAPVLDDALATLSGKDRDAVLLRFFNRKPFSAVAAETGVSEDAAKKRVSRALTRLREFFARRGTMLSSAALVAILSERVVQAAPAATTAKISAALTAGAATAASGTAASLLNAALRDLFWTKVKWGSAVAVGVVGLALLLNGALRPAGKAGATATSEISADNIAVVPGNMRAPAAATAAVAANRGEERKLSLLIAQAEDRQPVRGARVFVDRWDSTGMQRHVDSTTDSNGGLDIPVPGQFSTLVIWVSAEGRVPMVAKWQAHEFTDAITPYTLLLERGQSASGIVRDEAGNPVSNAKVFFRGPGNDISRRENREFHPELSASHTDTEGRWTTTQLPPQSQGTWVSIRVLHPDFTPADAWVGGLPGFPTNAFLALTNGVALSGQVTTGGGSPIANAAVEKQSGVYLRVRTDSEGRFTFAHVERGQTFVNIEAKGFKTSYEGVPATNDANEFVFKLTESSDPASSTQEAPRIHLRGRVVDDETGAPIERFKVLIGNEEPNPWAGAVLISPRFLGEARGGQFDWQIKWNEMPFRLQVEAEYYSELLSERRDPTTAEREFEFRLKRSVLLSGSVRTPDGLPADGAVLNLSGPGFGPVMQRLGQFTENNPGFQATRTRADRQGRFSLKVKTGARGLAIIHESGCALLQFAAATNSPIVLQPWGTIDGTVILSGQPAPNQKVLVSGCRESGNDPRLLLSFTYTATTDEHGHFRFEKVPPGEHVVARQVGYFDGDGPTATYPSLAALVKVEGGATASVELRRAGRLVIGRMVAVDTAKDVSLGMSEIRLTAAGSVPPKLDYDNAPAAAARAWALHQAQTSFPFALSRDGSIRADDVPPGNYTLSIRLKGTSYGLEDSEDIGSLQRQVTVPPADEDGPPVDLGDLKVERLK